jgi:hypothetical protein
LERKEGRKEGGNKEERKEKLRKGAKQERNKGRKEDREGEKKTCPMQTGLGALLSVLRIRSFRVLFWVVLAFASCRHLRRQVRQAARVSASPPPVFLLVDPRYHRTSRSGGCTWGIEGRKEERLSRKTGIKEGLERTNAYNKEREGRKEQMKEQRKERRKEGTYCVPSDRVACLM